MPVLRRRYAISFSLRFADYASHFRHYYFQPRRFHAVSWPFRYYADFAADVFRHRLMPDYYFAMPLF